MLRMGTGKLEEVRNVYASRQACLVHGTHTCGGSCYALNAPRYSYNGGPRTPEAMLRAEALTGDVEALDALLTLKCEAAVAVVCDREWLRAVAQALKPGQKLVDCHGQYEAIDQHEYVDYGGAIVYNFGSEYHRSLLK